MSIVRAVLSEGDSPQVPVLVSAEGHKTAYSLAARTLVVTRRSDDTAALSEHFDLGTYSSVCFQTASLNVSAT
eukprot:2152381-Amphidinium_carterae.1